ncbi:hypothetical protein M2650_03190 [Luteimonas sp. SX5]|uniref:DUF11 domain-containing protein n=1 Tax=Luteimonas galliterrae TaxID=2940486 RepID=A0ABT0MHD1_9GAMM|nr:kelch repeat-containing protein [Luteimonas galliterrae]MCL1633649.1 hypothetical protein [Luteimonas galliterrae]
MRPMSLVRALWYGFVALIPWLLLLLIPFGEVLAAHFERAGDLRQGRDMAMAATLPDGRVLVTGGVGLNDEGWGVYLATSELFDPATNAFVPTGAMNDGRDGNATLTPLADGRVLVTGGIGQNEQGDNVAFASAEVYDPATGQFTRTANDMSSVRYFHTATLLADGRVLVTGGWGAGERLASADVYDPATNRFARVGDMTIERNSHTATLLADGRVLIAGGLTTDAEIVASAELFDPVSGHFSATGGLAQPRFMATASRLEDGRVLVGGGMDNGEWRPAGELYDPARGQFASAGSLHWSRSDHAQTTLPDGRVLLTAGGTDEGPTRRAERFDPVSGRFTLVANMALGRARAATAMLPDGRVLVAGGNRPWEPPLAIAEVYTPTPGPYADLALDMRSSSANVPTGGAFHYLLSLRNSGTIAARDAGIDIELPEGIEVGQIKVAESGLSGAWRCDRNGTAVSCASQGVIRPNPNPDLPRPALAIRIDAAAPATGSEWPLFATALASTSTNEDITANNETEVVFNVTSAAKARRVAAERTGGKTQPSRVVRDAVNGAVRTR